MTRLLFLFVTVVIISWICTALLRRYALAKRLVDIPNERSSHLMPTPRGGGIAIVLTFFSSLLNLVLLGLIPTILAIGFLGAGGIVALIGFLDDHKHLAARWRLLAHFIAATWGLVWLGGIPPLNVLGWQIDLTWFGYILAIMYLVWLLNLYNFMDGINGIAGIEGVTVCLCGMILHIALSLDFYNIAIPLLLAAGVAGFLLWNFPNAKIFMGDAGSGFVGIMLGMISIQAAWVAPELLWGWLILLGVFIADATVTLFRRVLDGQKFYEAHKDHAYQIISRRWKSHSKVTIAVAVINIIWLFPLAYCSVKWPTMGVIFLLIAYIPLIILAIRFGAGKSDSYP